MYDSGSALLVCQKCKKPFWKDEIKVKRSINNSEYASVRGKVSSASAPSVSDYPDLVSKTFWRTTKEEKYIRVRTMWAYNDLVRIDTRVYEDLLEKLFSDLNILFNHLSEADLAEDLKYDLMNAWWAWDKMCYDFGYRTSTDGDSFDVILTLTKIPVEEYPPPKDKIHESVIRCWSRNYLNSILLCSTIRANLFSQFHEHLKNKLDTLIKKHNSLDANTKYDCIREMRESFMRLSRSVDNDGILVDPAEANLERLLQIWGKTSETDALMRGEILRELGRFEECKTQLSRKFSKEHSKTTSFIKKLARQKKRCVARLV
jgi:hypothetical protein